MPTRTAYRQRLAADLRSFVSGTATSGSTTTLATTGYPFASDILPVARYEGWWIYVPTNDEYRYIGKNRLAVSGGTATFTVDKAWTNPGTSAFELHGHPFTLPELHEIINLALRRIMVPISTPMLVRPGRLQNLTYGLNGSDGIPGLSKPGWVYGVERQPAASVGVITLTETGSPSGGDFTATYGGQTTALLPIPYDSSASTLQTVLRTLHGWEAVTVTRSGTSTNFVWTVTLTGAPLDAEQLIVTPSLTGGSSPTITVSTATPTPRPRPVDGRVYLQGPHVYFDSSETLGEDDYLYVTAMLPAYYWCRTASTGAFGTRTTGLGAEAHEAVPSEELVSAAAQVIAWERFPGRLEGYAADLRDFSRSRALQAFHTLERQQRRTPERQRGLQGPSVHRQLATWGMG